MKKPSSIILYAAAQKLTDDHQSIRVAGGILYIRAYVRQGDTVGKALDKADPMDGEVVLNSIQHPSPGT